MKTTLIVAAAAVGTSVVATLAYKAGIKEGQNRVIRIAHEGLIKIMAEDLKEKNHANA